MGPFEAQVVTTVVGVVGALLGLFTITNFILKKKEIDQRAVGAPETLQELRQDLNATRAELAEVQERLDFAERLLTEGRQDMG